MKLFEINPFDEYGNVDIDQEKKLKALGRVRDFYALKRHKLMLSGVLVLGPTDKDVISLPDIVYTDIRGDQALSQSWRVKKGTSPEMIKEVINVLKRYFKSTSKYNIELLKHCEWFK